MKTIKFSLGAVALLLAVAELLQSGGTASAAFNDSDGDRVIDTIERIAGSDPFDADSSPENVAGPVYLGQPVCTDGVDNDLDGEIDEGDPGCTDADRDLVDDPTEISLGSDPNDFDSIPEDSQVDAVLATLGFVTFQCTNDVDDDHDGLIDNADPGCAPFDSDGDGYGDVDEKTYGSDPNNLESEPEDDRVSPSLCEDRLDNDGDGRVDVADEGCQTHATPSSTPAPPVASETPAAESTSIPLATATLVAALPATGSGSGPAGISRTLAAILALALCGTAVCLVWRAGRTNRGA